eukprot:12883505-Prorocentrum_lima.AAC.1
MPAGNQVVHVSGHTGQPWNELANSLVEFAMARKAGDIACWAIIDYLCNQSRGLPAPDAAQTP